MKRTWELGDEPCISSVRCSEGCNEVANGICTHKVVSQRSPVCVPN